MPSKSSELMDKMRAAVNNAKLDPESDDNATIRDRLLALEALRQRQDVDNKDIHGYADRVVGNFIMAVSLAKQNPQVYGGDELKAAREELALSICNGMSLNEGMKAVLGAEQDIGRAMAHARNR